MTEHYPESGRSFELKRLNERGSEELNVEAERMREQVLDFVFDAVCVLRLEDIEEINKSKTLGQETELYTVVEPFNASQVEDATKLTLSMLVRLKDFDKTGVLEAVKAYVPVPTEADIGNQTLFVGCQIQRNIC
ncbi:MAG: hypothetical protein U5K77_01585 [Candidatus Saccharibacteria bacterium]|nr:hypothetical protein [Candidatus Saccharibacteria bacterium]